MRRAVYLIIILIPCLMSLSFSVNYTVQFKSGEIVQGELVKQDDVQVTIKLPSGTNISYYKVIISKIESSTDYHTALGDELYKEEKYTDAIKEYDKVLEFDPKNEYAQKQINRIEEWHKSQAKDIKSKQNELAVAILLSQGMSYYRNTFYEIAARKFEEVLTYEPNNQQAKQYLKLANEKALEKQDKLIKSEQERLALEKNLKDLQREEMQKKQMELAASIPAIPLGGVPGAGPGGLRINLISINQYSDSSTTATLHVISNESDRDLVLEKNQSERIGDYRIRMKDIRVDKNEVEIEIIPAGSSSGQLMVLTPQPY